LLLQLAVGEDLYWLRNSNWDEPSNWRLGRLPCGREVATFTKTPANSLIYLKNNVTVRRIVLPTNGKIVLKPSVTIRFSEQSCGRSCVCDQYLDLLYSIIFIIMQGKKVVSSTVILEHTSTLIPSTTVPTVAQLPCRLN